MSIKAYKHTNFKMIGYALAYNSYMTLRPWNGYFIVTYEFKSNIQAIP